jgi:hypothetical protein
VQPGTKQQPEYEGEVRQRKFADDDAEPCRPMGAGWEMVKKEVRSMTPFGQKIKIFAKKKSSKESFFADSDGKIMGYTASVGLRVH